MPAVKKEDCHTCHMTDPMSLADLIRTHPLRSTADHRDNNGVLDGTIASSNSARPPGKVNNYISALASSPLPPPPPPPPPPPAPSTALPHRNTFSTHELKSHLNYAKSTKKKYSTSKRSTNRGGTPSDKEMDISTIDPIESFLHSPRLRRMIFKNDPKHDTIQEPQYAEFNRSRRIDKLVGKIDKKHKHSKQETDMSELIQYSSPSSSDEYNSHEAYEHRKFKRQQSVVTTPLTENSKNDTFTISKSDIQSSKINSKPEPNARTFKSHNSNIAGTSGYDTTKKTKFDSIESIIPPRLSPDAQMQTYDVVGHPSQPTPIASTTKKDTSLTLLLNSLKNKKAFSCGLYPRIPLGFLIAGYALLVSISQSF